MCRKRLPLHTVCEPCRLNNEYSCVHVGGVLSVQIQHSGGVHSPSEGSVANSQRLRTDHEDGTGNARYAAHIIHMLHAECKFIKAKHYSD